MVVNNWFIVVNMYTSLHDEKYTSLIRLYFITFWILVVLLLMNIMIAIVLEIYDTLQPEIESQFKVREDRKKLYNMLKDYDKPTMQKKLEEARRVIDEL